MAADQKDIHASLVVVRDLPNNLTITSSVVKEPQLWWEESFLFPHEPMRMDLKHMREALHPNRFTGLEEWKVKTFFWWFKEYFFPIVHAHHDLEEQLFIPWVNTRAKVPPKVADDHKELMRLLRVVLAQEKDFNQALQSKDDDLKRKAADNLRECVRQLEAHLLPHLVEEEEVVAPLIGKHFTSVELDGMVNKIVQKEGLVGGKRVLPWVLNGMLKWKGAEGQAKFVATLPPPIRHLYLTNWRIDYEKNNQGALNSLLDNPSNKPFVPTNTNACCSIWGLCCCFCRCCCAPS